MPLPHIVTLLNDTMTGLHRNKRAHSNAYTDTSTDTHKDSCNRYLQTKAKEKKERAVGWLPNVVREELMDRGDTAESARQIWV